MSKDYSVYAINDPTDSYFTPHEKLFDLPSKLLVIGKSLLSGKSSLIINLLARPEFYKDLIKPEYIYIVSPTLHQEKWQKLINHLDIPQENLYNSYNTDEMQDLYDMVKEEFEEMKAQGERPPQRVIIFDDLAFSGLFSSSSSHKDNLIDAMVCNGRHYLLSVWILAQKYTQLGTVLRENATALIIYEATNKQLEQISDDHDSTTNRKEFIKQMKLATKEKHNFFFINYSKTPRFYHNFDKPILFETKDENEKESKKE